VSFDAPRYLTRLIDRSEPLLREMSDAYAAVPRAPGKWSRKQVMGHLIDSASNNHQRFVRAQLAEPLVAPGYEQDIWVDVQQYQAAAWADLVTLWAAYNRRLAAVLAAIPAEKLPRICMIGDNDPMTLHALADDYVTHLAHHLRQVVD
jgi:hypothetical protein